MRAFPKYATLFLAILFLGLNLKAEETSLKGIWKASDDRFPQLHITESGNEVQITAQGGFLKGKVQSVRMTSFAGGMSTKLQVSFPYGKNSLTLNLRQLGKSLQASWIQSNVDGKALYAVYSKVTRQTASVSRKGKITGNVFGAAKSTASIFHVSLYGPDDSQRFISTQSLGKSEGFDFSQLEDGEYWMYVEPRGETIIRAFPSAQKVIIEKGEAKKILVELK
ncbi:MAG: hypothetical protein AAFY71_18085 [Bacteroidota bacterium]